MLGSHGNEQLDLENNIVDIQNLDDVSFYIRSEVSNAFTSCLNLYSSGPHRTKKCSG